MSSARDEYDYGAVWRSSMTNEEFAECARRPDEYINSARPLRVSAYVLKSQTSRWDIARIKGEPETSSVGLLFTSLFLASLSLENVLKAVLLVRKPELAEDGKLSSGIGAMISCELRAKRTFAWNKRKKISFE